MENNSTPINIVIKADNQAIAMNLATILSNGTFSNKDQWTGSYNGKEVNVYLRLPGQIPISSPQTVTHALIISIEDLSNENVLQEALVYSQARRGIPFRYVTGSESLADHQSDFAALYVKPAEVDNTFRSKLLDEIINYDVKLYGAYEKHLSGAASADALVNLCKELNHDLNQEEANGVVLIHGSSGSITFEDFRNFWYLGRFNFNTYKGFSQIESKVGAFVRQGSKLFNEFIQKNLGSQSTSSDFTGKIDIGTDEDIEHGLGLSTHIKLGKDADSILANLPSSVTHSPLVYSLKFTLDDAESALNAAATLNELKELLNMIPQYSDAANAGVSFEIRSQNENVFIDVILSGMLGDVVLTQLNQFNLSAIEFSGSFHMEAFTAFKLTDALNLSVEEIIEKLVKVQVKSEGGYNNIKSIAYALFSAYSSMCKEMIPVKYRPLLQLIKLLGVIRKTEFVFKYDATEVKNILIEVLEEAHVSQLTSSFGALESNIVAISGLQIANDTLKNVQMMVPGMLENMKPMIAMVLEPYMDTLKSINFDKIGINFILPSARLFLEYEISLPGLKEFIHEQVLS